jgi:hypothetical protein
MEVVQVFDIIHFVRNGLMMTENWHQILKFLNLCEYIEKYIVEQIRSGG